MTSTATRPDPCAFAWLPPVRVRCLRCDRWYVTRELQPRCPACGFREGPS